MKMREIPIDFNGGILLPKGYIIGKMGEHNATLLKIFLPDDMLLNSDINYFIVRLKGNTGETYRSGNIRRTSVNEYLSLSLWGAVTVNKSLSLQVEGYSDNDNLIAKTETVTGLILEPSVVENIPDPTFDRPIEWGVELLDENSSGNAVKAVIYGNTDSHFSFQNNSDITDLKFIGTEKIPNNLCSKMKSLKSVQLSDTVKKLGSNAFSETPLLEEITLPEGITEIPEYAFYKSGLKEIKLPSTVTKLCRYSYYTLDNLTELSLPETVTEIGENAFSSCKSLTKALIPKSIKKLGDQIFSSCVSLTDVEILCDLETLPSSIFSGCKALKSYAIKEGTVNIGSQVFANCSSLTDVTIPSTVKTIGYSAFSNCSSLESIEIPSSVTSMGSNCFYYCSALKSINLPDGIETIGSSTFDRCSSLESVTLPSALKKIDGSAFQYCKALKSITLPEGITTINYSAFAQCTSLKEVNFPSSLTSISNYAFQNTAIEEAILPVGITAFNYAFAYCSSLKKLSAPGVTKITTSFLQDNTALTELTIGSEGNPVTSIYAYTFSRCNNKMTIKVYVSDTEKGLSNAPWGASNATVEYLQA